LAFFITALYLGYLLAPMLLLMIGSVGATWSNTLLPTDGLTARWYLQVWHDRSFRLAFMTSLQVAGATVLLCAILGAPLAYAVASAGQRGVRLAARIIYLLPVAAPPIVLAFGLMLVFSSDTLPFLGATWVLIGGHVVLCLPYLLQTRICAILICRHRKLLQKRLVRGFGDAFLILCCRRFAIRCFQAASWLRRFRLASFSFPT
jgi:putative spermidine/putrescine transport system permease protein